LKKRLIDEDIYDCVVIDWWNYHSLPDEVFWGKRDLVHNIFRSIMKPMTGYYHWSLPGDRNDNVAVIAKMAKNLGYEGIEPYGAYDESFDKNFKYSADLAWNMDTVDDFEFFNERYAATVFPDNQADAVEALKIMREIMCSDTINNIMVEQLEYYGHTYLREGKPYPRNFPGEQFEAMLNEEDKYFPYLMEVVQKATEACKLFDAFNPSHKVDVWRLIAYHYKTLTEIYCVFVDMYKKYNNSEIDENTVHAKVSKLLSDWEMVMKLAEEVRIAANGFMYIRNMSVIRQFLIDTKRYFEEKLKEGIKPLFEIRNMDYVKSEVYYYLR
jgi:hypothetical protein